MGKRKLFVEDYEKPLKKKIVSSDGDMFRGRVAFENESNSDYRIDLQKAPLSQTLFARAGVTRRQQPEQICRKTITNTPETIRTKKKKKKKRKSRKKRISEMTQKEKDEEIDGAIRFADKYCVPLILEIGPNNLVTKIQVKEKVVEVKMLGRAFPIGSISPSTSAKAVFQKWRDDKGKQILQKLEEIRYLSIAQFRKCPNPETCERMLIAHHLMNFRKKDLV